MKALLGLAAALAPAIAEAGQTTCSNPGLPVGAAASPDLMPGRLSLTMTSLVLPIASEEVLEESQGPVLYDTQLVALETRFAIEYALTASLALSAALPYRMIDVDVTHRDPETGAPVPSPTMIHLRSETLRGLGDPTVGAHLAREVAGYRLHARFGTSLPVGRTEEDPHLLGSIGQEHQHIQLGTGVAVPFAALEAQRTIDAGPRVTLAAWALARVALYDNAKGFRPGDRYSGGLSASSSLGLRRVSFGLALEGHGETAETWQGIVYRDEGNAGRFDLLAGGSVSYRPHERIALIADVRYPVYSRVVGPQLDYGVLAGLGVAATFDLARRRPTWRGLDHEVVGPRGTAAELVPVPGRITVFDLWATWCAPCRELDRRLAAIARAHPERIAIRKLEVVDPDSAAWRRHLAPGGFDLPHVKVFGADGALLFERTAPPAELAGAVERLLR